MNKLLIYFFLRRAFMGKITPNIRSIYVNLASKLVVKLFYDSPPSDLEKKLLEQAITYFKNELHKFNYSIDFLFEVNTLKAPLLVKYPKLYGELGILFFKRYEKV